MLRAVREKMLPLRPDIVEVIDNPRLHWTQIKNALPLPLPYQPIPYPPSDGDRSFRFCRSPVEGARLGSRTSQTGVGLRK